MPQPQRTHFRVKDQKSFASLSSSGDVRLLAPEKFKTYDQNKFYLGLAAALALCPAAAWCLLGLGHFLHPFFYSPMKRRWS